MPTAMPIATISPVNRLFGSATVDMNTLTIDRTRIPSTYYMDSTGSFIRLRPLHRDGFAAFRSASRIVGIYTGRWDRTQTFNNNETGNNNIVFRQLGTTATGISTAIANLQGQTRTTNQIATHNNTRANNLNNSVVYVNEGALKGTFFGGDQHITNNYYQPMGVVDASNAGATDTHTGHALLVRDQTEGFYENYFPGLLGQLMQLGQLPQSIAINLAPKGRSHTMTIKTNIQYFPETMFETPAEQSLFVRSMIMSFI
ncbi:hypothetical protein [Roseibium sp. RKSG952]|uniref:hypothetical protein n=1 Tax=Roseibium sp. RKSG952 TaxID=2529384 RepID=UPI0012BD1768|nr:hypothetical protein [Roseibium sp. RKSG952]MTI00560.1 hypothetical protein [Roseibium sp. RKSG952]